MVDVLFDTAGLQPVVAIVSAGELIAAEEHAEGRAQSVLDVIDRLLSEAQLTPTDIERVGVGIGPGGFTGLRVGVTTARALAISLECDLIRLNTLEVCAWPDAMRHPGDTVWADIDARRSERFIQPFRAISGFAGWSLIPVADMSAVPEDAVAAIIGTDTHAVSGPTAEGLRLAAALAPHVDPYELVPNYGREPDAQPSAARVKLRVAAGADIDAMLAVEQRGHAAPWTRHMVSAEFDRDEAQSIRMIAENAAGDVLGFAIAALLADAWHVMDIVVDPDRQRLGIGRRLLNHILAIADRTSTPCTLEVRTGNQPAIALYEQSGFDRSGERPGYYADTGEAAIVMWREVPAT